MAWPVHFDEYARKQLVEAGFRSAGEAVVGLVDAHLVQLLNVSVWVARDLLQQLYDFVMASAPPQTALALVTAYRRERAQRTIRSPLQSLNALLSGGGLGASVFEVTGAGGAGKTQFSLSLAVNAALHHLNCLAPGATAPGLKWVAYVDTEGSFDADRLAQIASARLEKIFAARESEEAVSLGNGVENDGGADPPASVSAASSSSHHSVDHDDGGDYLFSSHPHTRQQRSRQHHGASGLRGVGAAAAAFVRRELRSLLRRVVVYRRTTVTDVLRVLGSLPLELQLEEEAADCSADVEAGESAAAPPVAVQLELGLVIVDSVAAAARHEFDAAAWVPDIQFAATAAAPTVGTTVRPLPRSVLTASRGAAGFSAASAGSGAAAGGAQQQPSSWLRADALARLAALLKSVCDTRRVPVLVTNQITTSVPAPGAAERLGDAEEEEAAADEEASAAAAASGEEEEGGGGGAAGGRGCGVLSRGWVARAGALLEDQLVPALGPSWAHGVNTRFFLTSAGLVGGLAAGRLAILKSPDAASRACLGYVICGRGVEDANPSRQA